MILSDSGWDAFALRDFFAPFFVGFFFEGPLAEATRSLPRAVPYPAFQSDPRNHTKRSELCGVRFRVIRGSLLSSERSTNPNRGNLCVHRSQAKCRAPRSTDRHQGRFAVGMAQGQIQLRLDVARARGQLSEIEQPVIEQMRRDD